MINSAMKDLHDFFAINNTLYALKDGQTTVISANADHNYFYNNGSTNTETVTTTETGVFQARLYFVRAGDNQSFKALDFNGNTQNLNVNVEQGTIKLVVDASGKHFIEDAERITWDDYLFDVKSSPSRHGLLGKQFYTYYLEPVK